MDSKYNELLEAITEANRCLKCKNPLCKTGCPISTDIPEFVFELSRGNIGEANKIISRKNSLSAICGRVCAHELQCQGHCILNKTGNPIQVGKLEKAVADFKFDMQLTVESLPRKNKGKVAVIGSGPAGLTVASDLAQTGFEVTVFEALSEPGGILLYGIPSFRLSKKIVRREIKNIEALGVIFKTNCVVGEDITVDKLFEDGFDAVFIGTGTSIAKDLPLPGRELFGIIQSSYLLRMNYLYRSGQLKRQEIPVHFGEKVLVIGAGNVGMDAARTAKQLGAASVTVIHRSSEENMPALRSEFDAARSENVDFLFSHTPVAFKGSDGTVSTLAVETDEGEKDISADKIFLAVGSRPADRIVSSTQGIDVDPDGYVVVRKEPYGMTTKAGVFAGGDVVHRPATVVLAMKEAKLVAQSISEYVNAVHLLKIAGVPQSHL